MDDYSFDDLEKMAHPHPDGFDARANLKAKLGIDLDAFTPEQIDLAAAEAIMLTETIRAGLLAVVALDPRALWMIGHFFSATVPFAKTIDRDLAERTAQEKRRAAEEKRFRRENRHN